jgi:hypothetical protein
MKKTTSLLTNLLMSSTLFLGVPIADGQELVRQTLGDDSSYCHMNFPSMREETLSWDRPLLNENVANSIDFYVPCDHNPLGQEEIRVQRRVIRDGIFADGDWLTSKSWH